MMGDNGALEYLAVPYVLVPVNIQLGYVQMWQNCNGFLRIENLLQNTAP